MPKVGILASSSFRMTGTEYSPVAAGIAGAVRQEHAVRLHRQNVVGAGRRRHDVTAQPASASRRRMLRFTPKSMATTLRLGAVSRP